MYLVFAQKNFSSCFTRKVSVTFLDVVHILYTSNRQVKIALLLLPSYSFSKTTPIPYHFLIL